MASSLDTSKFSEMIKSKRGSIGLRTLAKEIGISSSTLSRVEQENLPDIDTYIKLCNWLEVSTDFFKVDSSNEKHDSSYQNVIAHLRADKTLSGKTSEALIQMINVAYDAALQESKV